MNLVGRIYTFRPPFLVLNINLGRGVIIITCRNLLRPDRTNNEDVKVSSSDELNSPPP